jgi:hypothetical protein
MISVRSYIYLQITDLGIDAARSKTTIQVQKMSKTWFIKESFSAFDSLLVHLLMQVELIRVCPQISNFGRNCARSKTTNL